MIPYVDGIIGLPAAVDDQFDAENPRPQPSVLVGEWGDQRAYLWAHSTDPTVRALSDLTDWPPEAYIMGVWDATDGSWDNSFPLHEDLWEHVMRFHNEAGEATGIRSCGYWQGHAELKAQNEAGDRYPEARRPFDLRITRQYVADPNPAWSGWGWRVDMVSADPLRDITARAIGIYDANWNYRYTTGAFIDAGGGNYFTECPIGQRQAEAEPIHFALLLGSAQEGRWVLEELAAGAEQVRSFWAT